MNIKPPSSNFLKIRLFDGRFACANKSLYLPQSKTPVSSRDDRISNMIKWLPIRKEERMGHLGAWRFLLV